MSRVDDATLLAHVDEGWSYARIAAKYQISASEITKAKRRAGRPIRKARHDWAQLDAPLIRAYLNYEDVVEIAARLGVSENAARARLHKLNITREKIVLKEHGIPARWQEGCRCTACTTAMREYKKDERERTKDAGAVTHGPSGWARGCRCKICVTAMREQSAQRQQRTRDTAIASGEPWSKEEDEAAMDHSRRIEDIAVDLGRTYTAVDNRRRLLKRRLRAKAPETQKDAPRTRASEG